MMKATHRSQPLEGTVGFAKSDHSDFSRCRASGSLNPTGCGKNDILI